MEKEQSSGPPFLMTSLPEDIIIDILARVPRYNYPTLSLVSKHFRSLLAVGSTIYAFCGIDNDKTTTSAFAIDCISHTAQPLTSIPAPMCNTIADIIDGKIYVIGNNYFDDRWKKVMVVFNIETQKWEKPVIIKAGIDYNYGCVVMADTLYRRDDDNSFVYALKENKWETDEMLNLKEWENACVVDDLKSV
ncbi:unnamed protein product [Thlaspi arvense]|uniref:F-box domain-containing protein n=1 Tax=Thlaspi arvense TaxID=13288 RepID=A0AAU9SCE4_THLAR|nr:unnamed protein product [Thlaspi arvense]